MEGFKNLGGWEADDARVPNPGDIIFFDWQDNGKGDNTGRPNYVGLVETAENGKITIIEVNYSDAVYAAHLM